MNILKNTDDPEFDELENLADKFNEQCDLVNDSRYWDYSLFDAFIKKAIKLLSKDKYRVILIYRKHFDVHNTMDFTVKAHPLVKKLNDEFNFYGGNNGFWD